MFDKKLAEIFNRFIIQLVVVEIELLDLVTVTQCFGNGLESIVGDLIVFDRKLNKLSFTLECVSDLNSSVLHKFVV